MPSRCPSTSLMVGFMEDVQLLHNLAHRPPEVWRTPRARARKAKGNVVHHRERAGSLSILLELPAVEGKVKSRRRAERRGSSMAVLCTCLHARDV